MKNYLAENFNKLYNVLEKQSTSEDLLNSKLDLSEDCKPALSKEAAEAILNKWHDNFPLDIDLSILSDENLRRLALMAFKKNYYQIGHIISKEFTNRYLTSSEENKFKNSYTVGLDFFESLQPLNEGVCFADTYIAEKWHKGKIKLNVRLISDESLEDLHLIAVANDYKGILALINEEDKRRADKDITVKTGTLSIYRDDPVRSLLECWSNGIIEVNLESLTKIELSIYYAAAIKDDYDDILEKIQEEYTRRTEGKTDKKDTKYRNAFKVDLDFFEQLMRQDKNK